MNYCFGVCRITNGSNAQGYEAFKEKLKGLSFIESTS